MKAYKSISPKHVDKPYIFKETSQRIYSFEGLVFYCYKHWMEALKVFDADAFGHFISDTLMLKKKHQELISILNNEGSVSNKLLSFLEASHYFTCEQLSSLKTEMDSWEALPIQLQYKTLGDQAFKDKKYLQALENYQQAQAINFDPMIEHNIGITYLKLYFFQEAEQALSKAAQESNQIEIQLAFIRLLKITNREDQALIKVKELIKHHKNVELLIECGVIYQKQEQYEKALEIFKEAYQIEDREDILIKLMEVSIEISSTHPLLTGINNLPKEADYYILKSQIYLKEDRIEDAIEILEEGVSNVQDNSQLYMILSRLYRKNKQLIKAIGAISEAAKDTTLKDEIIFEMALIAKRAGNWQDYEAKIDELLKLWKNDVRRRFS